MFVLLATGSIPSDICQVVTLRVLNLSANFLHGESNRVAATLLLPKDDSDIDDFCEAKSIDQQYCEAVTIFLCKTIV